MGSCPSFGQPHSLPSCPTHRCRLATTLPPPNPFAGVLRPTGSFPGGLLPSGQLGVRWPNHRTDPPESALPGQCSACSGEGCLPLSLRSPCTPAPLWIRVGSSCGTGSKAIPAHWLITPSNCKPRCAGCATPLRKIVETVRVLPPATGPSNPSPKACAKSPGAKPVGNLVIPDAPFSSRTIPSISKFIPCWSATTVGRTVQRACHRL